MHISKLFWQQLISTIHKSAHLTLARANRFSPTCSRKICKTSTYARCKRCEVGLRGTKFCTSLLIIRSRRRNAKWVTPCITPAEFGRKSTGRAGARTLGLIIARESEGAARQLFYIPPEVAAEQINGILTRTHTHSRPPPHFKLLVARACGEQCTYEVIWQQAGSLFIILQLVG